MQNQVVSNALTRPVPSAEAGALPPTNWHRHFTVFDGLMGHHTDALIHLTAFAKMIGVILRPVTLSLKNNYALTSEKEILARITPRTKAIAIINPGNPTGTVLSPSERALVARIAKKKNLFIIADETYRDILFFGKPTTMLSDASIRDRVIAVDSASKRFSLPGAPTSQFRMQRCPGIPVPT